MIGPPRLIGIDQLAALWAATIAAQVDPCRAGGEVEAALPATLAAPESAAKPPSCDSHDDDQDREAGEYVLHLL